MADNKNKKILTGYHSLRSVTGNLIIAGRKSVNPLLAFQSPDLTETAFHKRAMKYWS